MTEEQRELTPKELEEQAARELPDREELSVISSGPVGPPTILPGPNIWVPPEPGSSS